MDIIFFSYCPAFGQAFLKEGDISAKKNGNITRNGRKGIGEYKDTHNNKEDTGYDLENSDHLLKPIEKNEKLVQCQR